MKTHISIPILLATTLFFSACGGGKSAQGNDVTDGSSDVTDSGDNTDSGDVTDNGDVTDTGDDNGDTDVDVDKTHQVTLTGIPSGMASAICFDANGNGICDPEERLLLSSEGKGSSIYEDTDFNLFPPFPPLLVEISDPTKINFFEKTTLSFPGDSKELSMKALIKNADFDDIIKKPEDDRDIFLTHLQNLNVLGEVGMSAEDANTASMNEIASKVNALDCGYCGGEVPETPWLDLLKISKEEAYEIAKENRGDEKALVNDKLVDNFRCETDQVKTIKNYGFEDVFDLSNGVEPAFASNNIQTSPNLITYNNNVGSGFVNYDDVNNNRMFAENIKNLPSTIVKGRIFIGFKSNGSALQHNDAVYIGNYTAGGSNHYSDHLQDLVSSGSWGHQLVGSSNPTTDVYWNDFSALNFHSGNQSLLDYVQTSNQFDVLVQDDTAVDFITVAMCSKKDPVAEITPILEKFECKAEGPAGIPNETHVSILGGIVDAYANGSESATPSSALVNATAIGYPPGTTDYDATRYDKALIDTLTLPTGGYITRARLSVGVKALGSNLHSNDRIYLGYTDSANIVAFDLYGSSGTSVNTASNLWNVTPISNLEKVIQSDFLGSNANSLSWLRNQSTFDLLVQDDTSVDFVQLDLCMTEKPPFLDTDGDGYSDEQEQDAGSDPENPHSTPDDLDGDGVPNGEDCDPNNPDISEGCNETPLPESCQKEVTVDLRPAASWQDIVTGNSPTENNVFSTYPPNPAWANVIWDGAMNWFDFGNASNTEHHLKVDFCSCGGGAVKVDEMKSDNKARIYLDSDIPSNVIVQRTAHSQSTMSSWGPSVWTYSPFAHDGVFPYTGNGVNRSLNFKVKNASGPSGGSVNGTLSFTGHLGKCTAEDVLPPRG